jgi:ABC-type transport system substrate-binding protein
VIYSFERLLKHKRSPQRYALSDITEMTATDDHTLILTTKTPNGVLRDRLNNRNIFSKAAGEKYGSEVLQHPTGTGPYKFVSWQRDGHLVLARNDDYWRPRADIREIITRQIGEDAARVSGLLAGQGDVINNVPIEEISRIERNPKLRIERAQGQRMYFLALNPASTSPSITSWCVRLSITRSILRSSSSIFTKATAMSWTDRWRPMSSAPIQSLRDIRWIRKERRNYWQRRVIQAAST